MNAKQSKRVVLFSDIRGFTSLTAKRGDREAYRLVRTFVRLVEEQVERYEGKVVKTYGDGVMTTFPDLESGLKGSIGMQKALKDHNERNPKDTISAGTGLHLGEFIQDKGDIFGQAVNLAARLANYAHGGQIITSSTIRNESADCDKYSFMDLSYQELKGIGRKRVYELLWRDEVSRLKTKDDGLILVLTENHLGIELSKDVQKELKKARDELRREARGESGFTKFLLEKMENLFDRYLSKYIDRVMIKKGIGLEHPLEKVQIKLKGDEMDIFIDGEKAITLSEEEIDFSEAKQFARGFKSAKPQ